MSLPWSLRGRLLLGAALWTVGLFFLAIVLWHVTLGNRHPPRADGDLFDHAAVVAVLCAALLVAGLLQVRRGWSPINQLRARLARLDAGAERGWTASIRAKWRRSSATSTRCSISASGRWRGRGPRPATWRTA